MSNKIEPVWAVTNTAPIWAAVLTAIVTILVFIITKITDRAKENEKYKLENEAIIVVDRGFSTIKGIHGKDTAIKEQLRCKNNYLMVYTETDSQRNPNEKVNMLIVSNLSENLAKNISFKIFLEGGGVLDFTTTILKGDEGVIIPLYGLNGLDLVNRIDVKYKTAANYEYKYRIDFKSNEDILYH